MNFSRVAPVVFCALAIVSAAAAAAPPAPATAPSAAPAQPSPLKTEHFDRDPNWEGFNNRVPTEAKAVRQDFGYSRTNHAGQAEGEIGGTVWRSSTPASYAAAIEPRTLDQPLSASGTFAITACGGSSGVFFGWFKSDSPATSRQNTLGFRLSGQGSGARLSVNLVTATNQSCGTKVTPWVVDRDKPRGAGRKYRPTDIRNDGTKYHWTLGYDPAGDGKFTFTIHGDSDDPKDFEGKRFTVALPAGYKQQATTFDRFGMLTSGRPGNSMTIWFDDVDHDGVACDFADDPKWIGTGNRDSYAQHEQGGAHDFGYSDKTNFAGGEAGEVGGVLWRSGPYAYYADRVQPLSLDDRLEASGKIILEAGPPDSGIYFGWFNSREKTLAPPQAGNFLGVKIGGPTRVGHYFTPAYATTQASLPDRGGLEHAPNVSVERKTGPVLAPQKPLDWKVIYDPADNDGKGIIRVTLGEQSVTLPLKDGDRRTGATFDRFGLISGHRGGNALRIYFDDLTYTAAPAAAKP